MFRKPLFFIGALCLALFVPASSSAKTTSQFYQPHFLLKVEDATNRLQFLSARVSLGNRWGLANTSATSIELSRVSQSNIGINFFFTENGVENKPQGLFGTTKVPYKQDRLVSIIFADLESMMIWNFSRSGTWCIVPVGGRVEQNELLCLPSLKDAQEVVDAIATLAVACGADLRNNFGMYLRQSTEKEVQKHPENAGCAVFIVDETGPAATAGFKSGDILRTVNSAPCTLEAMRRAIAEVSARPEGGDVHVEVLGNQGPLGRTLHYEHVEVDVAALRAQIADPSKSTAAAAPAQTSSAVRVPAAPAFRLGISVRALNDADLPVVVLPKAKGVLITKVEKDSLADEMQMQVGDAIIEVNGSEIADPGAFTQLVRGGAAKNFKVWRKGQAVDLVVPESL